MLIIFIALGILMISVTTVVLLLIADKRQEKGALPLRPKVGPQEELTTPDLIPLVQKRARQHIS